MISIFSGQTRSLTNVTDEVYIQVSVGMRNYLHLFNNGKNLNSYAVFSAICMHINGNGWSFPGTELLSSETGISTEAAMTAAIAHMAQIKIEGHQIVQVYRLIRPNGQRGNYYYHVFPEVGGQPPAVEGKLVKVEFTKEPAPDHHGVDAPPPDQPPLDDQGHKKNHDLEEKPVITADGGQEQIIGETNASIPEGMNEATAKAMLHDCLFCYTRQAIHWYDETCPVEGCGARIIWTGNKWLEKKLRKEAAQAKAAQSTNYADKDPAIDYIQKVCQAKVHKAEHKSAIAQYVSANGLEPFKRMVDALYAADHADGKFGNGIINHICAAAPGYGKGGYSKKPSADSTVVPGLNTGRCLPSVNIEDLV